MRVAIWPEYDDPGILGIYDGRFVDDGSFPAETVFFLPKGAVISDACSLSAKGQHFCQLFRQEDKGAVSEVRLKLPFPNFYLSFHYKPFDGKNPERDFSYDLKTNHQIRKLEVDIQEPLRAANFAVLPTGAESEEIAGFKHYRYTFSEPKKGEVIPFKVSYKKEDNRASVNIKYSPMNDPTILVSPHEERGRFVNLLYVIAGAGLLTLAGIFFFLLKKKSNKE